MTHALAWTAPRAFAQAAPTPPPLGVAFVVATNFSTGSYAVVDLGSLTKPNDLDGLPDMYRMLLHDGLLYVILQHFDQTNNFQPVGPG
jgi:hypothetical protein